MPKIILKALRMCQSVICAICPSNLCNLWFSNVGYAPNTISSKIVSVSQCQEVSVSQCPKKSVSVSVLKQH